MWRWPAFPIQCLSHRGRRVTRIPKSSWTSTCPASSAPLAALHPPFVPAHAPPSVAMLPRPVPEPPSCPSLPPRPPALLLNRSHLAALSSTPTPTLTPSPPLEGPWCHTHASLRAMSTTTTSITIMPRPLPPLDPPPGSASWRARWHKGSRDSAETDSANVPMSSAQLPETDPNPEPFLVPLCCQGVAVWGERHKSSRQPPHPHRPRLQIHTLGQWVFCPSVCGDQVKRCHQWKAMQDLFLLMTCQLTQLTDPRPSGNGSWRVEGNHVIEPMGLLVGHGVGVVLRPTALPPPHHLSPPGVPVGGSGGPGGLHGGNSPPSLLSRTPPCPPCPPQTHLHNWRRPADAWRRSPNPPDRDILQPV